MHAGAVTHRQVEQYERDECGRHKEYERGQQAREILADDQHLSPERREEVVMQAPVNDFSTEEVHKYPGTAEKYDRPQDQYLEDAGKHHIDERRLVASANVGRNE